MVQKFIKFERSQWKPDRLSELLSRLGGKKLAVIGDVGVDRYTIGAVERISPEAPVPVVAVTAEKFKLGLAANVADNIRVLGGVPLLIGVVGDDRAGEDFRALLAGEKIGDGLLIADGGRRTVVKDRIVSERQQLLRVDYETLDPISEGTRARVVEQVKQVVDEADALILEDYAKGLISPGLAAEVFAAARKAGKPVLVDPNRATPVEHYRGATVMTPNTREAEHLAGMRIRDEASLMEVGNRLLEAADCEHVVITRGKEGMAVFTAGSDSCHLIPTSAREVYDVSGAGDTVISVLALGLAGGATVDEAAVLGNIAAGVEVGKRGTATVTREEILKAMEYFLADEPPPVPAGPDGY